MGSIDSRADLPATVPVSAALLRDFTVFSGFEEASRAALDFLHERLGFALWMVTRTEGDDWIVLNARDESYGIGPGDVFRWSDSFCSQMVQGLGPMISADSANSPVYARAPVAQQLQIGAYMGAPVCGPNGALFGTLCAIDPEKQPEEIEAELPLLRLITSMLGTILAAELRAHDGHRRADREALAANQDALTGVGTRRFWDTVVAAEEERCRILATPVAVVAVDLDGLKAINDANGHHAGDRFLADAARAISQSVRQHDVVARVGGDEFAVLAIDCTNEAAARLSDRIRLKLRGVGVGGSVGYAMREPGSTIDAAWKTADDRMYSEKRSSRAA